jgi:dihydropteroate synthase
MGILNVTPDSFYDGGRYLGKEAAMERARQMADNGADIIDVGGESTRPGAAAVGAQEEMDRVCPVIEAAAKELPVLLSVDTTKSAVAAAAAAAGASIINDISGASFDAAMLGTAAASGAAIVLTHTSGRPREMQSKTSYIDLIGEIKSFLERVSAEAEAKGIDKGRIILDPGIGFGKTFEDNYRIIRHIPELKKIGFPLLIGLSRKSLIGKLYAKDENRLAATIALNSVAVYAGADIIRVHDVKAHNLAMAALLKLRQVS